MPSSFNAREDMTNSFVELMLFIVVVEKTIINWNYIIKKKVSLIEIIFFLKIEREKYTYL